MLKCSKLINYLDWIELPRMSVNIKAASYLKSNLILIVYQEFTIPCKSIFALIKLQTYNNSKIGNKTLNWKNQKVDIFSC